MSERTEAEVIQDAYSPAHMLLRAPVQGLQGGIPWPIHLEAYDAYCRKYGRQTALINLKDRGCRGGFHVEELDRFVPGWRDRAGPVAETQQRLIAAERELAELRERSAPDRWLEHDARHIAQGDFGTPYFLAGFANRVLALIGAQVEPEATFLRKDVALQDAVECRADGR